MKAQNSSRSIIMRFYHGVISSGCRDYNDEETNRKIVVVNLFALVGMSITLSLGIKALFNADYPLGSVLLGSAFLFAVCKGLLHHSKLRYSHIITPVLLVICLMSLMIFLIIGGGVANTGPLWIFVLPPVAMFFAGVVFGVVTMVVFTLICCVIMFYPGEALLMTSYPHEFKVRLLLSFATVTFLSAFYEHSRQTSFRIIRDISEKFEKQALNDPLTDLPNRRGVQQFIDFEIGRAKRQSEELSIILCDIDRFKQVNDKYGHDAGDIALQHVASLFKSSIRHQDAVSRWGGEEFLFVLPGTKESDAEHLADKIRQSLADTPVQLKNEQLTITASFGVAQLNLSVGLDKALSLSDKALYRAKENGRNQVVTASSLTPKA
ncbi:GGDEF domain-containing protein [Alteromonas gilva]|uniref:diguanylate cyclase n=1 Tax=Alteromonas gilva TaxID=2987522 RepID=A0ABT5L5Y6_9ALTE|nr:GGDEF domain-containing protein [Alteromonas gilva]MDC8831786.1 GGDEF domain-containing protein [Alteromonas gilva]